MSFCSVGPHATANYIQFSQLQKILKQYRQHVSKKVSLTYRTRYGIDAGDGVCAKGQMKRLLDGEADLVPACVSSFGDALGREAFWDLCTAVRQ